MAKDSQQALQLKRQAEMMKASAATVSLSAVQPHDKGVLQLVAQGNYRTTGKAKLRNYEDITKEIADLPTGTMVTVGEDAPTKPWRKRWISRSHTLVSCTQGTGWLKDNVLGTPVLAHGVQVPQSSVPPVASTESQSSSAPIGLAIPTATRGIADRQSSLMRLGEPLRLRPDSITIEELRDFRASNGKLKSGVAMPGSKPLVLTRLPEGKNVGQPREYLTSQVGGQLLSSKGAPLSGPSQPFVLDKAGQLYGGPSNIGGGLIRGDMINHAMAGIFAPAWAGMLTASNGKVTEIDNKSGTFKFTSAANIEIIKFLYRTEVLGDKDLRRLVVNYVTNPDALDRESPVSRHHAVEPFELEESGDDVDEKKEEKGSRSDSLDDEEGERYTGDPGW
jgi:hypothetical protein